LSGCWSDYLQPLSATTMIRGTSHRVTSHSTACSCDIPQHWPGREWGGSTIALAAAPRKTPAPHLGSLLVRLVPGALALGRVPARNADEPSAADERRSASRTSPFSPLPPRAAQPKSLRFLYSTSLDLGRLRQRLGVRATSVVRGRLPGADSFPLAYRLRSRCGDVHAFGSPLRAI